MRTNSDGTITDYIDAMDQEITFSPEAWARELELREEIKSAQQDYIDSLEALEADKIRHEHLASISQHDWYVGCEQDNNAEILEDATYRVFVKEQGQNDEISFNSRSVLNRWAGY